MLCGPQVTRGDMAPRALWRWAALQTADRAAAGAEPGRRGPSAGTLEVCWRITTFPCGSHAISSCAPSWLPCPVVDGHLGGDWLSELFAWSNYCSTSLL